MLNLVPATPVEGHSFRDGFGKLSFSATPGYLEQLGEVAKQRFLRPPSFVACFYKWDDCL
eukprot:6189065-Pleurochrysis_carterae.AAC.2